MFALSLSLALEMRRQNLWAQMFLSHCTYPASLISLSFLPRCFVNQPLLSLSIVIADHRRFLILKCRSSASTERDEMTFEGDG